MSWPDYEGKTVGFAKVMGELPVSDGSLAYRIVNFTATEEGFLDSKYVTMPLIPNDWQNDESVDFEESVRNNPEFEHVYAMKFIEMHGESPELLILTSKGVFKFSPSLRHGLLRVPDGSTDKVVLDSDSYPSNGLSEQYLFKSKMVEDLSITDGSGQKVIRQLLSVLPQSTPMFPAQMETVGNRIYFTFCDGGGAYVWDGHRIREFGYQVEPSAPHALGPSSDRDAYGDGGWNNGGGFSDGGRIGTLNYDLTGVTEDNEVVTSGGIESGLWHYAVVFENQDGSYSATSQRSSRVTIQFHVAQPTARRTRWGLGFLRRRFWINDIPKGPQGTVARILLRTMNLTSLPAGDTGEMRFLHRIPNNSAQEYMDDIPDSELGRVWDDRRSAPPGFYFMKYFGGSMFVMRTEDHPSRVWWSEQGTVTGSIPESFMHNHWRDVFPETGPITGAYSSSINGQQTLLVFKKSATHYISSSYEQPGTSGWSFGTLSTIAGCSGPSLCQSTPDGMVIWYGSGTFWMWGKDTPGVIDIGSPIRKALSEVNEDAERFGISWITKKNKEVVFCLPVGDSNNPNQQFVWDYRNRGWRLRKEICPTAVETIKELTLVANNTSDHRSGNQDYPSYASDILVYQRGYPSGGVWNHGTKYEYISGWQSFADFGPDFHATHRTADSVFTMQERSLTTPSVVTYSDWNMDDPVNTEKIYSINPENIDSTAIWTGTSVFTSSTISPVFYSRGGYVEYDPAKYDTSGYEWRDRRTYTHRLPVDIPSSTVFSIKLSGWRGSFVSLISIDAYGPRSSAPTSRSPAAYEGE